MTAVDPPVGDPIAARLASLLAATDSAAWMMDFPTGGLTWAEGAERVLGYDSATLPRTATAVTRLVHPDEQDLVLRLWGAVAAGHLVEVDGEFRLRTASGAWRWMHSRGRVLRSDANGAALEAGGIIVDVTQRKYAQLIIEAEHRLARALEKVRDRAAMLEALFDALLVLPELDGGGLYWRRPDGGYDIVVHRGLSPAFVAAVDHLAPDSRRVAIIRRGLMVCACAEPTDRCSGPAAMLDGDVAKEGITAAAIIPIMVDGVPLGCLNLASRHARQWSETILDAFESLARQLGHAVERFLAHEELETQRQNLEALFDSMTDLVFVIDLQGTVIHHNRAAERLGYGDALRGQHVLTLHPPELHAEAGGLLAAIVAGTATECPFPIVRADGSRFPAETRVVHGRWSGQPVLMALSRDVSEREAQRRELAAEKAFSDHIIESLPGIFYMLDGEGRVARWNQRLAEVTGIPPEELRGLAPDRFFDPRDLPAVERSVREVLERGDATLDASFLTARGPTPYSFRGHRAVVGDATFLVGIGVDVSAK